MCNWIMKSPRSESKEKSVMDKFKMRKISQANNATSKMSSIERKS